MLKVFLLASQCAAFMGWGERGEKPVLRNKQQASWTPTSTCLLNPQERHSQPCKHQRSLSPVPLLVLPLSCVDVFTSLWKEANDNSIFLYLNGMAKLLWNSLQRRNNVWAGLGKTFLPFLPSHPLQAICRVCSFLILCQSWWFALLPGHRKAFSTIKARWVVFLSPPKW